MTEATRRSYDAVAARYSREIGGELAGKPADLALLDRAAAAGSGGIVADVGCGPGQVGAYLAGRGARVVGIGPVARDVRDRPAARYRRWPRT